MNITEFKSALLLHLKNDVEIKRLKNLTGKTYRFLVHTTLNIIHKDVSEQNMKHVWTNINFVLSNWDKLNRSIRHSIRNDKSTFEDYSDLAYNGVTEDF